MENFKVRLDSISNKITELRIENNGGISIEDMDKKLYDIDILICKVIDDLCVSKEKGICDCLPTAQVMDKFGNCKNCGKTIFRI